MEPAQFLVQLKKQRSAAGYLFLGNELFARDGCRRALIEAALPAGQRPEGLLEYDLGETALEAVLDEARTLSLFTPARLIVAYNAEAILARRRADEEEAGAAAEPAAASLAAYFRNPTPDVVLLVEATRLDWDDRDERKKLERLAAFFTAVPVKVEFRRLEPRAVVEGARQIARRAGLELADDLLPELAEALGYDMARVAGEISKLALYAVGHKPVTRAELAVLVPEARTSGLFELTDALTARNRVRALDVLSALTRTDVYLPLQVSFLAAVFRQALVVKEAGARNAGEAGRVLEKLGFAVWAARVRQAVDTAGRFSREQLEQAIVLLFETDRDLRRERPDDRIVMERLVLALTTPPPAPSAR